MQRVKSNYPENMNTRWQGISRINGAFQDSNRMLNVSLIHFFFFFFDEIVFLSVTIGLPAHEEKSFLLFT